MLVKICGITMLEDAEAAVDQGADAVGFILWPESPRFVTPERVREIVDALPALVMKVGVFVNQPAEHINDVARRSALTHVQLHGDETPSFAASLTIPVIKATSLTEGPEALEAWPAETMWLVDAHEPILRGGTGRPADWSAAAGLARQRPVWLAGGLTSANVGEAVRRVRPFGIDVSSGVERAPGVKDHGKLKELFAAVSRSRGETT
jgi:phosphoribosylanthranilate isomerase